MQTFDIFAVKCCLLC